MISDYFRGPTPQRWCSAIIVGVGAIGSHLVGHLARLEGMERIRIIDSATYDVRHARGQHITSTHIGKWKAQVQKQLLKQIDGKLKVEAISEPLENLSLGLFR